MRRYSILRQASYSLPCLAIRRYMICHPGFCSALCRLTKTYPGSLNPFPSKGLIKCSNDTPCRNYGPRCDIFPRNLLLEAPLACHHHPASRNRFFCNTSVYGGHLDKEWKDDLRNRHPAPSTRHGSLLQLQWQISVKYRSSLFVFYLIKSSRPPTGTARSLFPASSSATYFSKCSFTDLMLTPP